MRERSRTWKRGIRTGAPVKSPLTALICINAGTRLKPTVVENLHGGEAIMVEWAANAWVVAMLFLSALFTGTLIMIEVGRRIWLRRYAAEAETSHPGRGAIEGATFALLGLLIAFTFSGAASRFDARRELIVQEANDVGTAYLRLDLLPPVREPRFRRSSGNISMHDWLPTMRFRTGHG